ncbi:MAG: GNAT family N-acetyltransferase [Rubrobacteraceae bacterium]
MSGISSPSRVDILVGDGRYLESCLHIGKSLPEYFNEAGLKEMRRSLSRDDLYMAMEEDLVVAFATVADVEGTKAEIAWFAVSLEQQRKGVGRSLLARVEKDLIEKGVELLTVETLAEESDYPPFESTRRFYERNGFLHAETMDPYPGWGGDPAAFYAKTLSTGRTG